MDGTGSTQGTQKYNPFLQIKFAAPVIFGQSFAPAIFVGPDLRDRSSPANSGHTSELSSSPSSQRCIMRRRSPPTPSPSSPSVAVSGKSVRHLSKGACQSKLKICSRSVKIKIVPDLRHISLSIFIRGIAGKYSFSSIVLSI